MPPHNNDLLGMVAGHHSLLYLRIDTSSLIFGKFIEVYRFKTFGYQKVDHLTLIRWLQPAVALFLEAGCTSGCINVGINV